MNDSLRNGQSGTADRISQVRGIIAAAEAGGHWPPLFVTPVSVEDMAAGDGLEVCDLIEALCTVSKDGFAGAAGENLELRVWQWALMLHLFARHAAGALVGRRLHRLGLIGMPRKNGKSGIASGVALDGLLTEGRGAEIYSAAAEKEQAKIVFGEVKRTVEASPELLELCRPMRDVIEVPSTNSVYRALSAEAYSKEGLNPNRSIVDELHAHPTRELFDVLNLAMGARRDPMLIAITTAGVKTDTTGGNSVCFELYLYGVQCAAGDIVDPSFFFAVIGTFGRESRLRRPDRPARLRLVRAADTGERVPHEASQSVGFERASVVRGRRLGRPRGAARSATG